MKYDAGLFFTLLPGVMPEAGAYEVAEATKATTKLNRDIRHLQQRIRENPSDRDAEVLLAELILKDEKWRPDFGPDHA